MKLLQITKEIEQALTTVCHITLRSTGLEHSEVVNQIKAALQAAPEAPSESEAEQPQA